MRVILYTGKGGVGKTSVAAATACRIAGEGKRVIIMSTDQAHSLGDSFGIKLSGEPMPVKEDLDACEIDVVKESEDAWGKIKGYMKQVLLSRAEGGVEVEELLVFPGLEELFSLFKILDVYEKGGYDVVVVDCAPTGETLSLLKFPEIFGNLIERILPGKRKVIKVAGPAVEKLTKIPMPKDDVFSDVERLMNKLERLQELMLNKDIVSVRIVTTPEKIVIKEAKRNFTCLQLYDYNVDAVIVNKVYPKEALEGYFHKWVDMQEAGMQELAESFRDIPLFQLMLQRGEIKTLPILERVSELYGDNDPSAVLTKTKIFQVHKDQDGQRMEIYLPFADKSEMELGQKGGELQISIKNERRCFALPDSLKGLDIIGAKFRDGVLVVAFG